MREMPRNLVIDSNHTLIARDNLRGKEYLRDSTFFGRELTMEDVIDEVGDDASVIYRLDVSSMSAEDITEQVALAWIQEKDDQEFGLDDERTFPLYVRDSDAWKRWNNLPVTRPHIPHNSKARLEYRDLGERA
jgi:hypothetical protein